MHPAEHGPVPGPALSSPLSHKSPPGLAWPGPVLHRGCPSILMFRHDFLQIGWFPSTYVEEEGVQ